MKALDYFNQSLALRKTIGDHNGVATTLFQMARLENKRGNLAESRKHLESALTIIESVRANVASQQLRASFFASVQQNRELYIELLMRLHEADPSKRFDRLAFRASENGRARSLLEMLKEANTEIRHGVDPLCSNVSALWASR